MPIGMNNNFYPETDSNEELKRKIQALKANQTDEDFLAQAQEEANQGIGVKETPEGTEVTSLSMGDKPGVEPEPVAQPVAETTAPKDELGSMKSKLDSFGKPSILGEKQPNLFPTKGKGMKIIQPTYQGMGLVNTKPENPLAIGLQQREEYVATPSADELKGRISGNSDVSEDNRLPSLAERARLNLPTGKPPVGTAPKSEAKDETNRETIEKIPSLEAQSTFGIGKKVLQDASNQMLSADDLATKMREILQEGRRDEAAGYERALSEQAEGIKRNAMAEMVDRIVANLGQVTAGAVGMNTGLDVAKGYKKEYMYDRKLEDEVLKGRIDLMKAAAQAQMAGRKEEAKALMDAQKELRERAKDLVKGATDLGGAQGDTTQKSGSNTSDLAGFIPENKGTNVSSTINNIPQPLDTSSAAEQGRLQNEQVRQIGRSSPDMLLEHTNSPAYLQRMKSFETGKDAKGMPTYNQAAIEKYYSDQISNKGFIPSKFKVAALENGLNTYYKNYPASAPKVAERLKAYGINSTVNPKTKKLQVDIDPARVDVNAVISDPVVGGWYRPGGDNMSIFVNRLLNKLTNENLSDVNDIEEVNKLRVKVGLAPIPYTHKNVKPGAPMP